MAKGRINKTNVDRLACPAGKSMEVLWDDALRGFGVVVLPSGLARPSSCNASEMAVRKRSRLGSSVR